MEPRVDLLGKTVAVTGAGGFIGRRVIERALAAGAARVQGLERSPQAAEALEPLGAEIRVGDVCDPRAAAEVCAGADVLVHTAAVVRESGDLELFRRVNNGGTATVGQAAVEAGVRRMLHLSSVMVYGFRFPDFVDELGPLRGEGNPYCVTKIESERIALDFHGQGELSVVAIRPGDVYGPGSVPWVVRPLQLLRRGLMRVPRQGVLNHVYVDNLIDGMFLAIEGPAGNAYNVTDGVATPCVEFFARLAALIDRRPPPAVSPGALKRMSRAFALGYRLFGRQSPATAEGVDFLDRRHTYSIAKARQVLGYAPRIDLAQGMARVAASLRDAT